MIMRRSNASFPRPSGQGGRMSRGIRPALAVLLLLSLGPACSDLQAQGNSFRVVVNASNPVDSLTKTEVSRLFLKRDTRWKNGFGVSPADQLPRSELRAEFSESIHSKKTQWIKSYWQKLIFSGRNTPPPELQSDREVLDFVRHNVGAIGYVSAQANLGQGVKVLRIIN